MEQEKRVKPDVITVALLDEIAERLMRIEEMLAEAKPEGMVEPTEPITVTEEPRRVSCPIRSPWFSVEVVNDGPSDVWVRVNPEKTTRWHLVGAKESYAVPMGRPVIKELILKCKPEESTTVRVVGSR